jgi:DNA-binding NtrC family response regulator
VVAFGPEGVDFDALVNDFEDRLILQALQLSGGNKKEAARLLRLNRTTLLEKMKKKSLQYT